MNFKNLNPKQQKLAREIIIIACVIGAAVFAVMVFIWPKWGIAGLVLCLLAWDYRRRKLLPVPRWYLSMDGAAVGPYRKTEIENMARRGLVHLQTPGCLSGGEVWHPLGFLFPKLPCLPVAPPGPIQPAAPVQAAPPIRDGCLHTLGTLILLVGVVACFTVIGLPLGVPMVLVGGVMMIAAK